MVIPLPNKSQVTRFVLVLAAICITVYIAYLARDIWLPLLLAFVIATVLDPVVDRMEARGWSRAKAAAFIFGSFILITAGLVYLSIPILVHEGQMLQEGFAKHFPDMSKRGLDGSLHEMGVPVAIRNMAIPAFLSFQQGVQKSSNWFTLYGLPFLSNLIWVVLVPIVAFYALRDFHVMLGKGLLLVPKKRRDLVQTFVAEVSTVFAKYLRGLVIVSIANGVATAILLAVLGVPSALLLGILAGILYTVPYIGAILTIVITAGVAFISGGLQSMVLVTALSILLHQVIFDQIVVPRVVGGQVGLHPILSIIALLIGNILFGIVGMILAVPFAACIQIGVLVLIPKLRHEIEVNTDPDALVAETAELSEDAKRRQIQTDESHDLHESVNKAVDNIEEKVKDAQISAP